MAKSEFNFLLDSPLTTTDQNADLKFGHDEISRTLIQIIADCPSPFTIGLFAEWGTGKSSVAYSLKAPLKSLGIPTVIFDVWKHEGDALRRTFLKETVNQLKEYGTDFFDPDYTVSENLEKSTTQTTDGAFTFNLPKLKKILPSLLMLIAFLGFGGMIAAYLDHLDAYLKWTMGVFGISTSSSLLFIVMQQSVKFISSDTVTYGVDRFGDPHEFETEFSATLKALRKERILVVFDNLDRVTENKVEEVLSTIKTFLEPVDAKNSNRQVVFLIPCDALAIKQHLTNVYGANEGSEFDPDEYLRKVFNSILWIPDFFPEELESFARERLRATNVPSFDNDNLAWLLTKAFRANPRQIIQFVNILLANYLLIRERAGNDKDFPSDFLDGNVAQLAKFLILKQLFPAEMDAVRDAKVANLENYVSQMLEQIITTENVKPREIFTDFVRETPGIPITNIQIFFTLRRSEAEKNLPGFGSFVAMLEDAKLEEANKLFEGLADVEGATFIYDFSLAMKSILETKTNVFTLTSIIDSLIRILSIREINLDQTVDAEINNAINGRCRQVAYLISPSSLSNYLFPRHQSFIRPIIALWIAYIDIFVRNAKEGISLDHVCAMLTVMADYPSELTLKQTDLIRTFLASERLIANEEIAKIIISKPEAQQVMLGRDYLVTRVELLGEAAVNVEDILEGLNWFGQLQETVFRNIDISRFLTRLAEIQLSENQRPYRVEKDRLIQGIGDLALARLPFLSAASEASKDSFVVAVFDGYNKIPPAESRKNFIPVLFILKSIASDTRLPSIDQAIAAYVAGSPVEELRSLLVSLPRDFRAGFFEEGVVFDQMKARTLAQDDFRNEFFGDFSDNEKIKFVDQYLDGHFAVLFKFIGDLDSANDAIKISVLRRVLGNFESMAPGAKEVIFRSIANYLDFASEEELFKLAVYASKLLIATGLPLEELALNVLEVLESLLPEHQIRQITKDIFDRLDAQELVDKNQPAAVRAILLGYARLNEEEKKSLHQFVFEQLIRKGATVPQIELGFEILGKLGLGYEERDLNFNDVLRKVEELPPGEIRNALTYGLKGLRPPRLTAKNKGFWESVDAM